MDAIKLEGGAHSRITAARAIVEAGIAVMGHVGLTPQAISVLGGFRPQGRNIASAVEVLPLLYLFLPLSVLFAAVSGTPFLLLCCIVCHVCFGFYAE